MTTVTITAQKLCEFLGLDPSQGIYDVSMDAWDSQDTVIKIEVGDRDGLIAAGLHS